MMADPTNDLAREIAALHGLADICDTNGLDATATALRKIAARVAACLQTHEQDMDRAMSAADQAIAKGNQAAAGWQAEMEKRSEAEAEAEAERWHREALDWQQAKSEADDAWEAAEARVRALEQEQATLLAETRGALALLAAAVLVGGSNGTLTIAASTLREDLTLEREDSPEGHVLLRSLVGGSPEEGRANGL